VDAAPDLPIDDVSSTQIHEIMCTTLGDVSELAPSRPGPTQSSFASGNSVIIEIVK